MLGVIPPHNVEVTKYEAAGPKRKNAELPPV